MTLLAEVLFSQMPRRSLDLDALFLSLQLTNPKKTTLLMNQGCTLRKATGVYFAHKDDVIAFWVLASVVTFKPGQSALDNGQA